MLLQSSIVALLATLVSAQGFYGGKNGPVIDLTPSSFNDLVVNSGHASVVEFYAPWCGYCKQLKPEYIKAAKKTSPLVPFYAVNCDEEINKSVCAKYKIQGFPTIKSFRPGKKKGKLEVHDCDVERKAKPLADYAYSRIPNNAAIVTKKKVDKWLGDNADKTRVVLISKAGQSGVPALWKMLSTKFKDDAAFAFVPAKQDISDKFAAGIEDDSKSQLVVLKGESSVVYDGDLKRDPVEQFLKEVFAGNVEEEVKKEEEKEEKKEEVKETNEGSEENDQASEKPVTAETTQKKAPRKLVEEKVRIVRPHDHIEDEHEESIEEVGEEQTHDPSPVEDDSADSDDSDDSTPHPGITPDPSESFDPSDPSTPHAWKRVWSFDQLKHECIDDERPCVILGTSVYGQLADFKNVNSAQLEVGKSLNNHFKYVYMIDIDDETQHVATELGLAPYALPTTDISQNKGKREWSHSGSLAVVSKGQIANLKGHVEFKQVVDFLTAAYEGELSMHDLPKRYTRRLAKEDL